MTHLLTLSRKDIVNNGFNNTLKYEFPFSGIQFKNCEIAVHCINMYNSAYNINSSLYGNNTFQIEIPHGNTTTIKNITLQNGYYNYQNINDQIKRVLVEEGAYLIDKSGNYVFYIQITENSVYYACQLDLDSPPTIKPADYSYAKSGYYSTAEGLPNNLRTPRLIINNEAFGKLIGFTTGTYPSDVLYAPSSHISNTVPQINPISSYSLRCSLITNPFCLPSDIITTFSNKGTTNGQQIEYNPNEHLWMSVPDGSYTAITLIIVDQEGRFVKFQDNDIMISLALRTKQ